MKTIKKHLGILFMSLLLSTSVSHAQQMFSVHVDNVKPEKMKDYETISKEFHTLCVNNNLQDISWTTITLSDARYIYVTPIENMADLDKNYMAPLMEKLGKETFTDIFKRFDECYDSHTNYIVRKVDDLSYSAGETGKPSEYGKSGNYREYHFLYYAPKNYKNLKEAMKEVKDLYKKKHSKISYSIYQSGFGNPESYFLVAISGEDELDIATRGKVNDVTLGDERKAIMHKVFKNCLRYEKLEGNVRPDLTYSPKQK